MGNLTDKNILVGVTGGVAVYKAAELVRLLLKEGANVRVVMTAAASEFVAPMTFQALSGKPVHSDLLDPTQEAAMGHISLARWAQRIVIAPATANFIAKLRIGIADDLLSTVCLATCAPMMLAPAMNQAMWRNPSTQDNISLLTQRGMTILGPDEGTQACGETGFGRLMEPEYISASIERSFSEGPLEGVSVLINAGPTREIIDPVRYISNRSSGKMGYALAEAASRAGATVTLVSGPVAIDAPSVDHYVSVETAREMFDAVLSRAPSHDIFIGCAAVSDYAPVNVSASKLKKSEEEIVLRLRTTTDILSTVASLENKPFVVGFAAETDNLEENAKAKLKAKNLDMIAANRVGSPEGGFESDRNSLTVFSAIGRSHLPMANKPLLAKQLLMLIADRFHETSSAKNP